VSWLSRSPRTNCSSAKLTSEWRSPSNSFNMAQFSSVKRIFAALICAANNFLLLFSSSSSSFYISRIRLYALFIFILSFFTASWISGVPSLRIFRIFSTFLYLHRRSCAVLLAEADRPDKMLPLEPPGKVFFLVSHCVKARVTGTATIG